MEGRKCEDCTSYPSPKFLPMVWRALRRRPARRVSIFMNFGVTGAMAGAKTYYVDDVTF